MATANDLLSVEAAARELSLSRDAVRLAIRRGVLPAVEIDKRTKMIRRADVERYRHDHLRKKGPRPKGDTNHGRDQ